MHSFNTSPLDLHLLSTPYQTHTRWVVLTGAACVGKTTLLEALSRQPESARAYFEAEQAKGRTLPEIRADRTALQRGILDLQLQYERGVPAEQVVILDRAVPDSLTFFRVFGWDISEVLPYCFYHRYAGVFILDRLPLRRDQTLGPEDDVTSDFLDDWLERDYASLGYPVVRVPVLPPEERLSFILERLDDSGFKGEHT
jgi:predicted ATPase